MKKRIVMPAILAAASLLLFSCPPAAVTDYQAYMNDAPARAVLVLNGNSESISAVAPATSAVYNHVQLVGQSGSNRAIPSDIMVSGSSIHVLLSGQNSMESYDKLTLDYIDGGRHYFKNGFNPMGFVPVPGTSWVFVPGFGTDEVQPVNLSEPETDYTFRKSWEAVVLPADANTETGVSPTVKNAAGDNKKRGPSSGAVLLNGSASRFYVGNVRYDSSILLTESDGSLAEYPPGSGRYVRAGSYFREGTVSIFGFDANAMTDGASDSSLGFSLIKEINLESLYYAAAGSGEYFPGDGLNPQSVFILDGRLNIVCTGTNGGTPAYYSSSEYIPSGFSQGDLKPGSDPDDGVIIVLDITDPDNPAWLTSIDIGGSPCGYRSSVDSGRKTVYLAGVGGLQSYRYGSSAGDYAAAHSSSNMLLTTPNPASDYYSGLYFDPAGDILYISFYSGDSLKTVNISGGASAVYSEGTSYSVGDGPGAVCLIER